MLEPMYGFEFVVLYSCESFIICQPHYENTAVKLIFDYFFLLMPDNEKDEVFLHVTAVND